MHSRPLMNELMNEATINAASFTMTDASGAVDGTLSYNGKTAEFVPTANLASETLYTVTVTIAATDLAGNPVAEGKTWSFTTTNNLAKGPPVVNLGTAGNYVILSKTGVAAGGASAIIGDVGVSPAARTFLTVFALTLDGTGTFATSTKVTGKLYGSDMTSPTGPNRTTAVADMLTAYSVAIDTAIELNGSANDVWIFQIAGDLSVANGTIFTLTGGTKASNIFFQVAGAVSFGTTADVKGIFLCQTAITVNTGAALLGRALSQTAVTLDANAVTQPGI